jgi:hypothetical protein
MQILNSVIFVAVAVWVISVLVSLIKLLIKPEIRMRPDYPGTGLIGLLIGLIFLLVFLLWGI